MDSNLRRAALWSLGAVLLASVVGPSALARASDHKADHTSDRKSEPKRDCKTTPRVDRQDYVSHTYPLDPYFGDGGLHLGVSNGRVVAHGLVHIACVPEGGMNLRLVQTSSPAYNANSAAANFKACEVTERWTTPVDQSSPPEHKCRRATGFASPKQDAGGTWILDLSSFTRYWRSHPNHGVALVPVIESPSDNWLLDFNQRRTRALATRGHKPNRQPEEPFGGGEAFNQEPVGPPRSGSSAPQPSGQSSSLEIPAVTNASKTRPPPARPPVAAFAPDSPQTTASAAVAEGFPWLPWVLWALAFLAVITSRTPAFRGRLRALAVRARGVGQFVPGPIQRMPRFVRIAAIGLGGAATGWGVLAAGLPRGLPLGILVLGIILGSLTAMIALGLVLVYRVVRAINMAQAEIGALAATVAVILVTGQGLSYFIAVPIGLVAALLTGIGMALLMRRFSSAPRLILTVATIGVAQLLAGLQLGLPELVSNLSASTTFTTPFQMRFVVDPITFTGDAMVALVVVPLVLVALTVTITRSDLGRALRAVADSHERAQLVGIPIQRVVTISWVIAAALSGIGALLSTPILGPTVGAAAGPTALLAPLAAAVIGRMESLAVTFAAAIFLGIVEQAIFWSYPQSRTVDVVLFAVILVGLLLSRGSTSRIRDQGLGQYAAVGEVRPVPQAASRLRPVRIARMGALLATVVLALGAPVLFTEAKLIVITYIAIFGVVAVSLVILTGWAGQVSLGQFAFAGVGAAIAATVVAGQSDLFLALALGGIAAALCAAVVGFAVLRLSGQFAAVATLAFAVPVSSFLLNADAFPSLNPPIIGRPILLERFPLDQPTAFYYLCVSVLVVALVAAHNLRRSRIGRALLAVRDNDRAAAAWSISPNRLKMMAFVIAGALAGIAGGLYVIGTRGMPINGFLPISSLQVFTMVVIGGLGSLTGAILGAVYVGTVQNILGGYAELLATGTGLLLLLVIAPQGLGGVLYGIRDAYYRRLLRRHARDSEAPAEDAPDALIAAGPVPVSGVEMDSSATLLSWRDVDASYGKLQVLHSVDGIVQEGETLALLGTNGAGKSTLLRVLAGVMSPGPGRIYFDGRDITRLRPKDRLELGIVTVPGGRGVFPSLSVEDNLRLFGWTVRHDKALLKSARREVYALFPQLKERRRERASQLSGGEQQMLGLAQAVICEPRLLLIDELTLGLAPAAVRRLLDVLEKFTQSGVTLLIVEQSLNTAAKVAERCLFMERGQIRYRGTIRNLMEREDLARAVFLPGPRDASVSAAGKPLAQDGSVADFSAAGVTKAFGGITAVDGIALEVGHGEIVGLIGPNGAGKTTLLDICSGFVVADTGRINLRGIDITDLAPDERANLGLGRVFQDARLVPSLTVREVLATALERHVAVREPVACILRIAATGHSERDVLRRVDELLDSFGLGRYANSFIHELSTGTRRVVELACSVAHSPSVLLLDEPTAGIAQRETEALAEMLPGVRESLDLSMIVVEHDLAFISSVADRLVCMDLGRELASGAPEAVLDDPDVLMAYFGVAGTGSSAHSENEESRDQDTSMETEFDRTTSVEVTHR